MFAKESPRTTKWKLITFGSGSIGHWAAARRLSKQAIDSGMFDEALPINARYLKQRFPGFWDAHRSFITSNRRGFGYWVWKPFIILETLRRLPTGWGLAYLDGGCVLNNAQAAIERLESYKLHAIENSVWAIELLSRPGEDFSNQTWCKADALAYFDCPKEFRQMNQVQAGALLLSNDSTARQLVELWYRASLEENYHFLDDTPSIEPSLQTFREHRHDQALFNIFFRKLGLQGVPDETYFPGAWSVEGAAYPIWSARWNFASAFNPDGKNPDGKISVSARIEYILRLGIGRWFKLALRRLLANSQKAGISKSLNQ